MKIWHGGFCAALGTLWFVGQALAAPQALLIGGGYALEGSQGQIELNVKWVQSLLAKRGYSLATYYTDGDHPGVDVYLSASNLSPEQRYYEPLARVYGQQQLNRERVRNHQVPQVDGSTRAQALKPALSKLFAELTPAQPLLMIYNGHGSLDTESVHGNALKLWGDTRLNVQDMHSLMGQIDPAVPQRYIFTQCYSGAFHDLIYAKPSEPNQLYAGPRCGFTAESAFRQSEGCSASVDIGDYRDYTTFMFSALSGRQRDGQALAKAPKGEISLLDAHLYALEHAYSTDLSRSSSEHYLEQWTPWYLRWMPSPRQLPDNTYARIARAVSEREGISPDPQWSAKLRQARHAAQAALQEGIAQRGRLRQQIDTLQARLQDTLSHRWPGLEQPFTAAHVELMQNSVEAVIEHILTQEDYTLLREMQDRDAELDRDLLDKQRRTAQIDKVIRMRHLAYLLEQFKRYASAQQKKAYTQLVQCEDSPL